MAHISPEANEPAVVLVERAAPSNTQVAVSPPGLEMDETIGFDATEALSNRIRATMRFPAATAPVNVWLSVVVDAALSPVLPSCLTRAGITSAAS